MSSSTRNWKVRPSGNVVSEPSSEIQALREELATLRQIVAGLVPSDEFTLPHDAVVRVQPREDDGDMADEIDSPVTQAVSSTITPDGEPAALGDDDEPDDVAGAGDVTMSDGAERVQ
jgi:hypothetical protein